MNTDLAKNWLQSQIIYLKDSELVCRYVEGFAKFLDEREESNLKAMVQPVHREPRKEDKPVWEHEWNRMWCGCRRGDWTLHRHCKNEECGQVTREELPPKQEPIEELPKPMMLPTGLGIPAADAYAGATNYVVPVIEKLNECIKAINALRSK